MKKLSNYTHRFEFEDKMVMYNVFNKAILSFDKEKDRELCKYIGRYICNKKDCKK